MVIEFGRLALHLVHSRNASDTRCTWTGHLHATVISMESILIRHVARWATCVETFIRRRLHIGYASTVVIRHITDEDSSFMQRDRDTSRLLVIPGGAGTRPDEPNETFRQNVISEPMLPLFRPCPRRNGCQALDRVLDSAWCARNTPLQGIGG